ncbi:integrase [Bradyrhizobium sp. LTSP849]|uniref:tyrosine-type recombinase/integrase n=1 Tax=Bradyrhizobium sp. LTSP849 TaxID=1615890 RepID=UPI0005D15670|nr:integrase arm-type DNA-binding domain-containing protein [Bradyrhizobium sp. LTSP849]KJC47310.1 integrase [Bradyrhizobium sp. LTSP849]
MRVTNKLTALGVTRAKKPGRYADGGGLYLQVTNTGSKSWLFRYMLAGQAREMGLGSIQTWTLAEARDRARSQRQLLDDDKDPLEVRKQREQEAALAKATTVTFEECASDYIEDQKPGWKNEKHAEQWTSTLKKWAYPIIGKLPVGGVTTDLVLKVLKQPISEEADAEIFWLARTETASRVRGRVEKILGWAGTRRLRAGDNPARWKGHLEHLLPAPSTVAPVEHHKALPYKELPSFMAELRRRDSLSARALEFTILTAVRTSDTIEAPRAEIDRADRSWTIAAARLKGRRGRRKSDHNVPLSERALKIVDELLQHSAFLFAHESGEPLSNMAMLELLQGMGFGEDLTVHGFRSTFKDWCSEQTSYPNEMSELALAHTVSDKVEAAYRRGDMREKRRRMMAHWARYCASTPRAEASEADRVVALRA